MPSIVVVGAQWGDEGKGKIIDLLTEKADHIVRSQGGNNAGHTIVIGNEEYKLHLIPSGILRPTTQCYIAAGTVIDPEVLLLEMQALTERGVSLENRFFISEAAHVIFPYHRLLDRLTERNKGKSSVGTTGRGIGPCYSDKAERTGIRMGDITDPERLSLKLKETLLSKNELLTKIYQEKPCRFEEIFEQYRYYGEKLKPYINHVEEKVHDALDANKSVLFEGAQGTFLDITVGTYPFVTSSNTTAGGICVGAGVGPSRIDHTIGVVKAYTTRVGNGPFPTEVSDEEQFLDHQTARELGTTTRRVRRIGWYDAVMLKTSIRYNGLQSLALTKLDILDSLDTVKICTKYLINGKEHTHFPANPALYDSIEPIYETMPGWKTPSSDATKMEELPIEAQNYIKRVEELAGIPISILSLGPQRSKTIFLKDLS